MSPQAKRQPAAAEPEPDQPKTPPERESWYRTVFSIAIYLCLLVLVAIGVPSVRSIFTPRSTNISQAPPLVEALGTLLDSLVEVRPSSDEYANQYKLGQRWYAFLGPILLLLGVQLLIRDKALVCRLQYWCASGMGVALITGCAYLLLEIFRNPG